MLDIILNAIPVITPIVTPLITQVFKKYISSSYAPLISTVLGILLNSINGLTGENALTGTIGGLAGVGLYSSFREYKKIDETKK